MNFSSTRVPYRKTGAFSGIVLDYIDQTEAIRAFAAAVPSVKGIEKIMTARKAFAGNRQTVVNELLKQYAGTATSDLVKSNIQSLLSDTTFTVTTAHQNNIFTGPLYFIYKLLHAVKLAATLQELYPENRFVPVYYIGSEDADFEELNHIQVAGDKLEWNTTQQGAVGRMKIDKSLLQLIDKMEGMLGVLPHGAEMTGLLRKYYTAGKTIQEATFHFVNELFASFGLVVLIPDNEALKRTMIPVFREELLEQRAAAIVNETAERLEKAGYKAQARTRAINLFYLKDDIRNRIELRDDIYQVVDTSMSFTRDEILAELELHPDRFSPNVILRGIYQETLLPDVAFIGGGGETAYWLQLKDLFQHYQVPFPVLVLRNSFLLVEKKWQAMTSRLGFTNEDLFESGEQLLNRLVQRESKLDTRLNGSINTLEHFYEGLQQQAVAIDPTLGKHVESLQAKSIRHLLELEKKMGRAEKRKFNDQRRQIEAIRQQLFPGNGLQERVENISYFYAKWGRGILQQLYTASLSLEQEFVILQEV